MAVTNFNALTSEQKTVWARDLWKVARNNSFINKFTGRGPNAMIQRITELTKSEKGTRAVITLVADLETDGIAGDNQLDGNEESIKSYDQVIQIDQLRNANRHKGRITDQKSIVNFRETARDVLGYWLADRLDQMAFLTLSGIAYTHNNDGNLRAGTSQLTDLDFAGDVTAPTSNRHFRWDGSNLVAGDTTAMTASDLPSYAMLVQMKAKAKVNYVRGIRTGGGEEMYHVFISPQAMAKLKLDSDYLANLRNAGPRGSANSLFSGSVVTQDGLVIHEHRRVFTTENATDKTGGGDDGAPGFKWGSDPTEIKGTRILLCGAQALGLADIGMPYWTEEGKDYENQQGIAIGKIFGLLKPQFHSQANNATEDFGVMCVDVAHN